MSKNPSLEDVLAYRNRDVVYRFSKSFGLGIEQSEDIFEQVKKWLWLGHQQLLAGEKHGLSIDLPLVVLDEMWHNFVLFTREYTAFCERYFGYYIHHAPVTEAEDLESKQLYQSLEGGERIEARKARLRPQYEAIYDVLGKDTFVKWYLEYPKTLSYRQLADLQHRATIEKLDAARPAALDAARPIAEAA